MQSQQRDIDRLADIEELVVQITVQLRTLTPQTFHATPLVKRGMVKLIENIGEGAHPITETTQLAWSEPAWSLLAATRHVYVHDYFRLNWDRVWELLVTTGFEFLAAQMSNIKNILSDRYSIS